MESISPGIIALALLSVFSAACVLTFIGYCIIQLIKLFINKHRGKTLKEAIKDEITEMTEQQKAEIEWMKAKENARHAWNEIANIKELRMNFYTHHDLYFGDMELCYEIENLPLYLKAYKCSMEKKPWGREDLDEIIGVIIFARDEQSIIDYMNCYQLKDPDASGWEYWSTNYLYDGMISLQPCQNLMEDIKHAQKAFIIDYTTGWKYRREKRECEEAERKAKESEVA